MAGLIDVGILKPELATSFATGYNQAEQQRNVSAQQKQQTEMGQLNLEQLKQDRQLMLQFQAQMQAAGKDPDLGKLFDSMIATGKPDYVVKGIEGKQRLKEQTEYAKLFDGGGIVAPETAAPVPAAPSIMRAPQAPSAPPAPVNALGSGMFGMEAPTNALAAQSPAPAAPVNALASAPNASQVQQTQKRINDLMRFAASNPGMANQAMQQARILQDQLELFSKRSPNEPADVQTMQRLGYPLTQAGYQAFRDAQRQDRLLNPAEFQQRLDLAAATRAPRAEAQPSAPVAVVDEATGKIKYVSREDAINKGMTPASAIESLPPKEIQKREAALPQAKQAVKTVSNTMSVIGQTVDSLLANPEGIDGITGLIYGVTPAITASARKAKAELEQLKNLAFIQGITELRAASKTGAAVGNVTNREGDRFENLKASLDRSQSKDDLIAALKKLKTQADLTTQFMTEAFDDTYSYKSAAPAGGRASGVDANNPLLKK